MFFEDLLYALGGVVGAVAALWIILYTIRTLIPTWRAERIREQSVNWPQITAKLDHACVTEYRPSHSIITYRLDAWFSYTVGDKIYDGAYFNPDIKLDIAKRVLHELNHEPVVIAFNPKKPEEYFFEPNIVRITAEQAIE